MAINKANDFEYHIFTNFIYLELKSLKRAFKLLNSLDKAAREECKNYIIAIKAARNIKDFI